MIEIVDTDGFDYFLNASHIVFVKITAGRIFIETQRGTIVAEYDDVVLSRLSDGMKNSNNAA